MSSARSSSSSSSSSAPSGIEARVDALAEVLRRHDLNEVEVEEGGVRIYIRKGGAEIVHAAALHPHSPAPVAHPVHTPSAPTAPSAPAAPSTDTSDGNVAYVTSPGQRVVSVVTDKGILRRVDGVLRVAAVPDGDGTPEERVRVFASSCGYEPDVVRQVEVLPAVRPDEVRALREFDRQRLFLA